MRARARSRYSGVEALRCYSGFTLPAAMIVIHFSISRSTCVRYSSDEVPIGLKPSSTSSCRKFRILHSTGGDPLQLGHDLSGRRFGTMRPISLAESILP